MTKTIATLMAAAAIVASVPGAPHASENPPGCADDVAGGEWRSYGQSNDNHRTQPEASIDAAWVQGMSPKWVFNTEEAGVSGGFSNTPVVADGCVYLASDAGWVVSLNADTGAANWAQKMDGAGGSLLGGVIVGSLAVEDGVVYAGVSKPGQPYVAAFDQAAGTLLWRARVVEGQPGTLINSSPKIWNGMVFQGFLGSENQGIIEGGQSPARGGFAILDASPECGGDAFIGETQILFCESPVPGATGGTRLAHDFTITDAEYEAGYRGASIWCTAAIDDETGYVYACGGNPASSRLEHPYSNALLKIDMNPERDTFGQIVSAYKGDNDQYYPGMDRQPVCDAFGDTLVAVWSLACLQLDLDFGSSPVLFTDSLGRKVVGDLQKSGVFHSIYANSMSRSWTTVVGAPCAACNAASPAFAEVDGEKRVFVAATPGAIMHGLAAENGRYRWATPVGGGTHFQSTSTANGMVFSTANDGFLHVYDAVTGLPIALRPLMQDTNTNMTDSGSSGVAIARDNVFVAQTSYVIAYDNEG